MSHVNRIDTVGRRDNEPLPLLGYDPLSQASPSSPTVHVAFDTSKSSEKPSNVTQGISMPVKSWAPITLRTWFAVSLLLFMLLVAAALEIALHFSRVKTGWNVPSPFLATTGIMHYVYTLPPVAVAMIIVSLWAWTDVDIKRMQPYIDLAYGNAPASRSLLLDYSNKHAAIASVSAYHHRHYIVAISSTMVLIGLAIQPLAASLFTVRDTWWNGPNINITSFQAPGLNPDFGNLTAFSTAAGFVQASVLYGVASPNFIDGVWAISELQVPSDQVANGTMFVNTTSIRSVGHCKSGDSSNLAPVADGTGLTLTGISDGCRVELPIQTNATLQYGANIVTCPNSLPPDPFKPVVFWTLMNPESPVFSLVYCTPTIDILRAAAQVALQTGTLQQADSIGKFTQTTNLTDPNGLMQGRAMNGIAFDLQNADPFTRQRAQSAVTALTSAIIQKAQMSTGGLANQMQSDSGMVALTQPLYELYLSLVAKENYFVPGIGHQEVAIKTFLPRLFIVDATAHVLTGVLIGFVVCGTIVHILHYRLRDLVILPRRPGTLASAAAFTTRSNLADILDASLDDETLMQNLRGKRFRIDRATGRIVMDGDKGFETGTAVPLDRRTSMMRILKGLGQTRD